MNTKLVDTLLEAVFFPGEEGGVEDQPRPRFKWQPKGGDAPSEEAVIPGDLGDYEDAPIPPRGSVMNVPPAHPPGTAAPAPSEPDAMDDRTGKYSMGDLMPKSEVATSDDLIDFFARIRDAKGKKKKMWQKEFDAHKTEFESRLHAFVDKLLMEAVCDKCGQEVGDRYFADKNRNGKKINICGTCYMQHGGDSLDDEGADAFSYTQIGDPTEPRLPGEDGPPGEWSPNAPSWERARLGRLQARRGQGQPPITPFH